MKKICHAHSIHIVIEFLALWAVASLPVLTLAGKFSILRVEAEGEKVEGDTVVAGAQAHQQQPLPKKIESTPEKKPIASPAKKWWEFWKQFLCTETGPAQVNRWPPNIASSRSHLWRVLAVIQTEMGLLVFQRRIPLQTTL